MTIEQSAHIVRKGGVIVAVGLPQKEKVNFDFVTLINKEADIKTVFRFRNMYSLAIDAVEKGKINIANIVTHEFNFTESKAAFDYVINYPDKVGKAMIKI